MAAHQAPPSLGFSRQEHWSGLPFPSPVWKWKVKVKSLSRVRPWATPWTAAYQAPPPMGFSRQEYWSGVPLPSPSTLLTWKIHLQTVKVSSDMRQTMLSEWKLLSKCRGDLHDKKTLSISQVVPSYPTAVGHLSQQQQPFLCFCKMLQIQICNFALITN